MNGRMPRKVTKTDGFSVTMELDVGQYLKERLLELRRERYALRERITNIDEEIEMLEIIQNTIQNKQGVKV